MKMYKNINLNLPIFSKRKIERNKKKLKCFSKK